MSNLWHIKLLKRWAWRLFIAVHTQQNAVCFESCLETNKLKWRNQLRESRFHEWTWPQTPQNSTWRQHTTVLSLKITLWSRLCLTHTTRFLPTFVLFYHNIRKVVPDGWQVGVASSRMHFACAPKNRGQGALRMVMSQYISLQLPWRPGRPVWTSGWPSQMGVPGVCGHCRLKALALSTWWESRFQFYPEWTTRKVNLASHLVYLYFSSGQMAYFPQTLQALNSPLGCLLKILIASSTHKDLRWLLDSPG